MLDCCVQSQVLDQQYSQGLRNQEQGYFGQFNFIGTSNGALNLEKVNGFYVQR